MNLTQENRYINLERSYIIITFSIA